MDIRALDLAKLIGREFTDDDAGLAACVKLLADKSVDQLIDIRGPLHTRDPGGAVYMTHDSFVLTAPEGHGRVACDIHIGDTTCSVEVTPMRSGGLKINVRGLHAGSGQTVMLSQSDVTHHEPVMPIGAVVFIYRTGCSPMRYRVDAIVGDAYRILVYDGAEDEVTGTRVLVQWADRCWWIDGHEYELTSGADDAMTIRDQEMDDAPWATTGGPRWALTRCS